MFIAANIVGCRLGHQDARCTHRSFNILVAVTILESFEFFANFYVWGWGRQLFALPRMSHGQSLTRQENGMGTAWYV
jgi:hypothetical protein